MLCIAGIAQRELHLVFGVLCQVEEAAGKHVRRGVVERAFEDRPLAADAQQRQALPPVAISPLPVGHRHGGIAIRVAIDPPLESSRDQRRRFDDDIARWCDSVARLRCGCVAVHPENSSRHDDYCERKTSGLHEGSSEKDAQG
jgi:hypothetical protein